jgi:hypothetical protein
VSVTPAGRGLRFSASRAVAAAYTTDVFRQSAGRRVLAQRLVARFTGQQQTARTWSALRDRRGRKLGDGFYFVRFSVKNGAEFDRRRIALRRVNGRFTRRPDFYGRAGCAVIKSAKLSGPSFGGTNRRPLGIAFQLTHGGKATVVVRKGTKTVLRRAITATGQKTNRVSLPFRGTRPGDYVVTVTATQAGQTETRRLTSRRL